MYEGQPIICQSIIEENWLEYLKFVKELSDKEYELSRKREEALAGIENPSTLNAHPEKAQLVGPTHRYYDLSLQGFWGWYISNKVEA